jgi:hypothetical protein
MGKFFSKYFVPAFFLIIGVCCVILLIGFTIVVIKDMLNN